MPDYQTRNKPSFPWKKYLTTALSVIVLIGIGFGAYTYFHKAQEAHAAKVKAASAPKLDPNGYKIVIRKYIAAMQGSDPNANAIYEAADFRGVLNDKTVVTRLNWYRACHADQLCNQLFTPQWLAGANDTNGNYLNPNRAGQRTVVQEQDYTQSDADRHGSTILSVSATAEGGAWVIHSVSAQDIRD